MAVLGEKLRWVPRATQSGWDVESGALFLGSSSIRPTLSMTYERLPRTGTFQSFSFVIFLYVMYYASLLQKWHHVMILVAINRPFYEWGHHIIPIKRTKTWDQFAGSVSLGENTWRESLERDGEGPYHDSTTKSLLGDWVFHGGDSKSPMGRPWDWVLLVGEKDMKWGNCFGERRSWEVLKTGDTGLIDMQNRSNRYSQTDSDDQSKNRLSSP
jgi:hypothetical protein